MGAPSMYLCVLAAEGKLDAKLSITADTGSENDRVWDNGKRSSAKEYFSAIIEPYCHENGIKAVFVRSQDKNGIPRPPIIDRLEEGIMVGVPLFGSNGGRLMQGCTDKWKVQAIRQELRRKGAKTAESFIGLTMDEVHRMRPSNRKWHTHRYPLIEDERIYKSTVYVELGKRNIPFLLSSECDMCPHKNRARWQRTSPEMIEKIARIEEGFGGTQFFTPQRIPLKEALKKWEGQTEMVLDSCDSGYCGV